MKPSKAYKAANYDAVEQEREKLSLALFELANGKFTPAISVQESDYWEDGKGTLSMRLSKPGLPVFLVEWSSPDVQYKSITVYTESELEYIAQNPIGLSTTDRMLADLFCRVKREHYPKAAQGRELFGVTEGYLINLRYTESTQKRQTMDRLSQRIALNRGLDD